MKGGDEEVQQWKQMMTHMSLCTAHPQVFKASIEMRVTRTPVDGFLLIVCEFRVFLV